MDRLHKIKMESTGRGHLPQRLPPLPMDVEARSRNLMDVGDFDLDLTVRRLKPKQLKPIAVHPEQTMCIIPKHKHRELPGKPRKRLPQRFPRTPTPRPPFSQPEGDIVVRNNDKLRQEIVALQSDIKAVNERLSSRIIVNKVATATEIQDCCEMILEDDFVLSELSPRPERPEMHIPMPPSLRAPRKRRPMSPQLKNTKIART
ncbi:hypothetical protein ScPMuIL_004365 [Solemya velum]